MDCSYQASDICHSKGNNLKQRADEDACGKFAGETWMRQSKDFRRKPDEPFSGHQQRNQRAHQWRPPPAPSHKHDSRYSNKENWPRGKCGIGRIAGEPLCPERDGESNEPCDSYLGKECKFCFHRLLHRLTDVIEMFMQAGLQCIRLSPLLWIQ